MSLPLKFVKLTAFCLLLSPSLSLAATPTCSIANLTVTTGHLVDNQDGTIADPNTGLEWKKCTEGLVFSASDNSCTNGTIAYNWENALQRAQAVNNNASITTFPRVDNLGSTDWRVPSMKELASIVELSCSGPSIHVGIFPDLPDMGLPYSYWASTPYIRSGATDEARSLSFFAGEDGTVFSSIPHEKSATLLVRLVRG